MIQKPHVCRCEVAGACPWRQTITSDPGIELCQAGTPPPNEVPLHCLYLDKEQIEDSSRYGQPVYTCNLHGRCTLGSNPHQIRSCVDCKDRLKTNDIDLKDRYIDPLLVTDSKQVKTDVWRNMLHGGAAFLVCGGPSLRHLPYRRLAERGIFSLGVNNVAGFAPCSAFVCSDPPSKFHWGIFTDPNIMKFLPKPKLRKRRGKIRYKNERRQFSELKVTTEDCPNMWGFERRSWLVPDDTWFTTSDAAWGNHKDGVLKTGEDKTVNTMLLGLRLLQYLGARTIFLVGVDFHMDPTATIRDNYSFGESRTGDNCRSNNNQYAIAAEWLMRLRYVFEKFGFKTYNCNIHSRLTAFDYVPFEEAIRVCKGIVPDEPFDLEGWYEKQEGQK